MGVAEEVSPQRGLVLEAREGFDRGGDDSGRQRRREHVRPADDTHDVEIRAVGDTEAADAAQALGKGADDEIDIRFDARGLGQAPAFFAEDAEGMGFVDQKIGAGLALHGRDFLQRGGVAEHGIDALDDNQAIARLAGEPPQALVEIVWIVVPKANHFAVAKTRAVIDACVAVGVEKKMVAAADQRREHPKVRLVAGAEHHGVLSAVELRQRLFQTHVPAVGAVGDPRAGGAGPLGARGFDRLFDARRIEREAQIVVRAQKNRSPAVEHGLGRRENGVELHVDAVRVQGLVDVHLGGVLGEYCHCWVPLRRSSTA